MLKNRVIPCLLLKNEGLVKTGRFSDPRYIGDPINTVRIFNEKEVDEIIVLDIFASKNGREPNYRLIEEFASECFMPLCYGGGLKSIEQAKRLFSLGVEKVSVQTSALTDFRLVEQIASQYGSQSLVISMDIKKNIFGQHKLYGSAAGKSHAMSWQSFLRDAISAGAGEILVNSVDLDGTMQGMDLKLIAEVSNLASVPLVAMGGVGSLQDIKLAVEAGASAVAAGAFFVYHGPHKAVLVTYPRYQELTDLLGEKQ